MPATGDKTTKKTIRDFEQPPVVEVLFGVQFASLQDLITPHVGAFWERIREDYPTCQDLPPLSPAIERYGQNIVQNIQFTNIPPLPRTWFVHRKETSIVQVQRDRFLHNWRKVKETDDYPRYDQVIEPFLSSLDSFSTFISENKLGELKHHQYEITYVNRIPHDHGWESTGKIGQVFPDFVWRSKKNRFLPSPEGVNWKSVFRLPEETGRLHVSVRTADTQPGETSLYLELTARGFPAGGEEDMRSWFDEAHRWVVLGFEDLTDESIRKSVWRQK